MDWIYFKNSETGGTTTVPDEPGVREWHEAHGWVITDAPVERPFVPSADGGQLVQLSEWVTLYHPAVDAIHDYPNNPDAIAGAMQAGWVYPPGPETEPETEPEPEAPKTTKKATTSVKASDEKEKA
jgi:hypothetical protein